MRPNRVILKPINVAAYASLSSFDVIKHKVYFLYRLGSVAYDSKPIEHIEVRISDFPFVADYVVNIHVSILTKINTGETLT